jgi:hypothetical protein
MTSSRPSSGGVSVVVRASARASSSPRSATCRLSSELLVELFHLDVLRTHHAKPLRELLVEGVGMKKTLQVFTTACADLRERQYDERQASGVKPARELSSTREEQDVRKREDHDDGPDELMDARTNDQLAFALKAASEQRLTHQGRKKKSDRKRGWKKGERVAKEHERRGARQGERGPPPSRGS